MRNSLLDEIMPGIQPIDPQPAFQSVDIPSEIVLVRKTKVVRCIISYISGYIARYLLRRIEKCSSCKQNITYQNK